jgi:guanylate kinase
MLLARRSDMGYSVSCTTRPPRQGEADGTHYHFLTTEEFRARRRQGLFAESAEVHGHLYGTLRSEVKRILSGGQHAVMDIDVQGARQFMEAFPDSVMVFLLPPSVEALLGRLTERNTESPETLLRRIRGAREELRAAISYQYVVVNDELENTYHRVASIVDAEVVRHARVPDLSVRVKALVDELDQHLLGLTPTT